MLLATEENHKPHVFQSPLAGLTSWLLGTLPYVISFKVIVAREALNKHRLYTHRTEAQKSGAWEASM